MPKPAYNLTQAASRLRVHYTTISAMLRDRRLPGIRVGKEWRIPRAAVDALCAGMPVPAELLARD